VCIGACVQPNGSRLSCGALKKIHSLIYARRQLQALVRLRGNQGFRYCLCFSGAGMTLLLPAPGLGTSRYCISLRSEP